MGLRIDNNGIDDLFEGDSVCSEWWMEICRCEERIMKDLGVEE